MAKKITWILSEIPIFSLLTSELRIVDENPRYILGPLEHQFSELRHGEVIFIRLEIPHIIEECSTKAGEPEDTTAANCAGLERLTNEHSQKEESSLICPTGL